MEELLSEPKSLHGHFGMGSCNCLNNHAVGLASEAFWVRRRLVLNFAPMYNIYIYIYWSKHLFAFDRSVHIVNSKKTLWMILHLCQGPKLLGQG